MLYFENVTIQKQRKFILSDINFSVLEGEISCVIGKNGAGKSTLLRTAIGLETVSHGIVKYKDINMLSEDRYYALWDIGVMLTVDSLYAYLTCEDNLKIIQRYYRNTRFSLDQVVDLFSLSEFRNKKVSKLSTGMKQRLALAIAFINCPNLVILDEPFNSVDRENTRQVVKLIRRLNQEYGTSFAITSHSFDDIESIYNSLNVLKDGKIAVSLSRSEVENLTFMKLDLNESDWTFNYLKEVFKNVVQDDGSAFLAIDLKNDDNREKAKLIERAIYVQRQATLKDIYEIFG